MKDTDNLSNNFRYISRYFAWEGLIFLIKYKTHYKMLKTSVK